MERIAPDVLVVGAGPAGLAAAAACAAEGLDVVVADREPDTGWSATYGVWPESIATFDLTGALSAAWPHVGVRFDAAGVNHVQARYALLDNDRLRARLARSVRFHRGTALAVAWDASGSTLYTDGGSLRAALVVDASGAASRLVPRGHAPTSFQTAWGEIVDTGDLDPSEPRFMDFTPVAGAGAEPTFLYALPLGDSRWLVEETSLVARPALPLDVLRRRLHARLDAMGVRREVHAVERVVIPLDVPVPPPGRVVAFGASAGRISPCTGYSVGRSLDDAAPLARAIARGLSDSPEAAANAAREVVWPSSRLRARSLQLYGADVLARLDQADTNAFFAGFFRLPPAVVRGWLADTLPPEAIAAAMFALFSELPARLRWKAASKGQLRHLFAAALA